jgi:hypothetical protein
MSSNPISKRAFKSIEMDAFNPIGKQDLALESR